MSSKPQIQVYDRWDKELITLNLEIGRYPAKPNAVYIQAYTEYGEPYSRPTTNPIVQLGKNELAIQADDDLHQPMIEALIEAKIIEAVDEARFTQGYNVYQIYRLVNGLDE